MIRKMNAIVKAKEGIGLEFFVSESLEKSRLFISDAFVHRP